MVDAGGRERLRVRSARQFRRRADRREERFSPPSARISCSSGKGVRLSSANSINIGRLAPQVVYYYRAYADLVQAGRIQPGDKVDYVVPTGNFGDILAGYFAKEMGLPVGKLVCASNANNVLTDFLRTGRYDRRRPFYKTVSPRRWTSSSPATWSACSISSPATTQASSRILMKQLSEDGAVSRCPRTQCCAKLHELHSGQAAATTTGTRKPGHPARSGRMHHYLCDTHTAVAWDVAQQYKQAEPPSTTPSSCSPLPLRINSPPPCSRAIGGDTQGDEFDIMDRLHAMTGVPIPANLASLRDKAALHQDVIDKDAILSYVLQKVSEKTWH